MKIPYLRKKPELKSCHNVTWEDNYSWIHQENILEVLRDKDKLLPEVREYLEKENEYTDHHLNNTKTLQKDLFNEIKGRIKLDDESLPYKDHTYEYWTKTTETGNYSIKLRKKIGSDFVEEIWNGDSEKEKLGVEYFGVGDLEVSNNDKYLGYSLDTKGSEYYTIFIREIKTNNIITKEISETSGGITFSLDDKYISQYGILEKLRKRARINSIHELWVPKIGDVVRFRGKNGLLFEGALIKKNYKWHVREDNYDPTLGISPIRRRIEWFGLVLNNKTNKTKWFSLSELITIDPDEDGEDFSFDDFIE